MRNVRFFFTKCREAAYISHLDLQRVMARSLRRAHFPVWYTQGFNPHIYMHFALPLSLLQESLCEVMDCKSEAENIDFTAYKESMNAVLPAGIHMDKIAGPVHPIQSIAKAEYLIKYPESEKIVQDYNALDSAYVLQKRKRSEEWIDLKNEVPEIFLNKEKTGFFVRLPVGDSANYNANLMTGFIETEFSIPSSKAQIIRTNIFLADGSVFT